MDVTIHAFFVLTVEKEIDTLMLESDFFKRRISMIEQSLVIIKPDAMQKRLAGTIIQRLEDKNLQIKKLKFMQLSRPMVEEHYQHLKEKPFFGELVSFMISAPVICMVLEGEAAISVIRRMVGATNALEANPGTIRGDFGSSGFQNMIHASDSTESAIIEIQRFFEEEK